MENLYFFVREKIYKDKFSEFWLKNPSKSKIGVKSKILLATRLLIG
jgi:hypothetical protein